MTDDSVVDVPDVEHEGGNGFDYDFYGKIDVMVDGLDLPQEVFEASCRAADLITGVDGFKYRFASFGGFDAVVPVSVYLGARQERVPLSAERVERFVEECSDFSVSKNFSAVKVKSLAKKFRRLTGLDQVFLRAEDYLDYYFPVFEELSSVRQTDLSREMGVSEVAVRYTYKDVVHGLTDVDTSGRELADVAVTPESFGFYGEGCKEFADFLLEKVREEDVVRGAPQSLAAALIYVSVNLV